MVMHYLQTTQLDLHRHFHNLGAGAIEEVRVQRDKGFGFVRYSTHAEAALAIQVGNTQNMLLGKQIKVRLFFSLFCVGDFEWLSPFKNTLVFAPLIF